MCDRLLWQSEGGRFNSLKVKIPLGVYVSLTDSLSDAQPAQSRNMYFLRLLDTTQRKCLYQCRALITCLPWQLAGMIQVRMFRGSSSCYFFNSVYLCSLKLMCTSPWGVSNVSEWANPLPPGAFPILLICLNARLLPQLSWQELKVRRRSSRKDSPIKKCTEIQSLSLKIGIIYPHNNTEEYMLHKWTQIWRTFVAIWETKTTMTRMLSDLPHFYLIQLRWIQYSMSWWNDVLKW